jgi:hypothetical protein
MNLSNHGFIGALCRYYLLLVFAASARGAIERQAEPPASPEVISAMHARRNS